MATQPRIRYDIEASASGAAEVEKLAREFEQLDGAFPEGLSDKVRRTSATLNELGNQQEAIAAFGRLSEQTQAAQRNLEQAQAAAAQFNERISASGPPTQAQAGQLQKLNDQVRAASDGLLRQNEALDGARASLRQFGISESQVAQTSAELAQQIGVTTGALQRLTSSGGGALGFQQLVRETDAARQRMEETARAAEQLAVQLQGVQRPTDGEAGKLRELRAAADTARADFQRLQTATVEQGLALRQAGVNTELLTAKTREAASAQSQAATAAQRGANAYAEQGAAAQRGAQQQTAAAATVNKGLEGIAGQLRTIQTLAATVLGGQLLSGTLGDVSRTADAYANLQARIKLVTGEGAALQDAFNGVFDVALRTNSAIEGTGTLFTRIAQAGKDLGLTTAQASQQALQLTETINQAIQVSGGSAQSADAAVTQLIQALQSGVLRGEEFNSVMEQAPRLARALADGLGVTTGELRKLAEAGTLTSTAVINALQGQSAALQREFEQLPPTVGKALQTLNTEWTRYVGEVDKANGISRTAAEAIQALARNLDSVGAALEVAGKAVAAYIAIDLAKSLYARAAAAAAAAAAQAQESATTVAATRAVAANTAAVGANTAAKTANTAATTASATATAASALAFGTVEKNIRIGGTAAAEATKNFSVMGTAFGLARAGAGALLTAIGGLPTVLLATILNARELGTWLGETAAKMLGAKDRSNELAEADRRLTEESKRAAAAKAEQAQKTQLAADKALGLTDASKKLVAEFDEVIKKGGSTSEALDKVQKSLNFRDIKGIQDGITALEVLRQKGEITAEQVRDSISKGLNGIDLGTFRVNAIAAFDGTAQGAERLRLSLEGIQKESLRRIGTSIEELRTGFSATFTSAVNDIDAVKTTLADLGITGEKASDALGRALNKATEAATTTEAVDAVIAKITALGEAGSVTGKSLEDSFVKATTKAIEFAKSESELRKIEQAIKDIIAANPQMASGFEGALETLKRKVIEVSPLLKQLQADAKLLGVELKQSTEQGVEASIRAYERLKSSGKASTGEIQQAFVNLAKKAIEAADGQIPEWVKVEAAMRGVRIETDAAGRATIQYGDDASSSFRRAKDGADSVVTSLSAITDAATKARKAADLSVLGKNVDKNGFATDANGNTISLTGQLNIPEGGSFDNAAFQRAQQTAAQSGLAAPNPQNFVVPKDAAILVDPSSVYGQYTGQFNGGAGASPFGPKKTGSSAPAPAPAPKAPSSATPTTVTININGKPAQQVNVASASDASALEAVLRQVADAARSSGFSSPSSGSY